MRKLIALLIIGIFLVSCTNVQLNNQVKQTTTEPVKKVEVTIPPATNTTVPVETTPIPSNETQIEDFGDII